MLNSQCQKVRATAYLFRPCPVFSHCQKMAFDWHNLSQIEPDHKQWAFPHRYAYFKLPKVDSFYTALAFYVGGLQITGLLY